MSESQKRRPWSSAEKMRIVLAGLEPSVEISELCRREGIQPTQYYNWKKQLVSSAESVFGDRKKAKAAQREQERHEQVLRRKDSVIAEITAENLELKKNALGLEDYGQLPRELQQQVVPSIPARHCCHMPICVSPNSCVL